MELSGIAVTAKYDNGCTDAIIDHDWLVKEEVPFDKIDLPDAKLADGKTSSLFGITKSLQIRTGGQDFTYRLYVGKVDGPAPILVGRGLAARIGIRIEGLPTQVDRTMTATIQEPETVQSLIELTASEPEEYTIFRKQLLQDLAPEIAANQAIPDGAVIPLQEAVVHLDLDTTEQLYTRQYPIPHRIQQMVDVQVDKWIAKGHVVLAPPGKYNNPLTTAPKKGDDGCIDPTVKRVCLDVSNLNVHLQDDRYPIPFCKDILAKLQGATCISLIDQENAYGRMLVHEPHRRFLAFTHKWKHYQFRTAPFGIKTLVGQFQRVSDIVLMGLPFVTPFLDDYIVFSATMEEHTDHCRQV